MILCDTLFEKNKVSSDTLIATAKCIVTFCFRFLLETLQKKLEKIDFNYHLFFLDMNLSPTSSTKIITNPISDDSPRNEAAPAKNFRQVNHTK